MLPQHRGWQIGRSLAERMLHVFETDTDTDVTFLFPDAQTGTNKKISAHKIVLKAGSPVFEAMFSGSFMESSKDVIISDVEPEIFRVLLKFLYTDSVEVTADVAMPLLAASNKYMVDIVTELCSSFIKDQINVSNACVILNDSLEYGYDTLGQHCCKFIGARMEAFIAASGHLELSQPALCLLLKSDKLAVTNEMLIYDACIEWAKQRVGIPEPAQELREELGDGFYHIRFHAMKTTEFAAKISRGSSTLTAEEKNCILCYMLTESEDDRAKLINLNFNARMRDYPHKLLRYSDDDEPYANLSDTPQGFSFLMNSDTDINIVRLRGFGIYGGPVTGEKLVFTLKFYEVTSTNQYTCVDTITREMYSSREPVPMEVKLSQSYDLMPNKLYAVVLEPVGSMLYYNTYRRQRIKFGRRAFHFWPCGVPDVSSVWAAGPIAQFIISKCP